MLGALKRWLSGQRTQGSNAGWDAVSAWADAEGHQFKRARDADGFVVLGQTGRTEWRLEVGPSQRVYIDGPELRIRGDAKMPPDLQMLVMSRQLMLALESETFAQFTDSVKTYADDSAPEEMRWLAMFRKLDASELGELAPRFGAAAPVPEAVKAWVGGEFREQLRAAAMVVPAERALLVMTNRSRVTLRTPCTSIEVSELGDWLSLFHAAVARLPDAVQALREVNR
jgi:hypothetical protein